MNCRIAKVLLGLYLLSVVCSTEIKSNKSATDLIEGETKPTISYNVEETDYYSDVDYEYEKKIQTIRTIENWIILGIYAISCLGSIVIIVILMHLKARRSSGLKNLML